MPYLKINSKTVKIDITFKDKYVFILGDSGLGKSLIVDTLSDEELVTHAVDTDLDIKILNKSTISEFDNWNNGELLVADEVYGRKVLNKLATKNCYILFVTRKVFTNINFSYRCLYTASRTEGITTIKQAFELKNVKAASNYDALIMEDSGYAKTFVSECFNNQQCIISANGKSNIVGVLKSDQIIALNKLLILFDGGGIGSDISRIMSVVKKLRKTGYVVHFLAPECFEQVLLCSKYFNYNRDVFKHMSLQDGNTESFCEKELLRLTEGTVLECNHKKGKMSECWYTQCNKCDKFSCKWRVDDDKFVYVLANGPYKLLLTLR